MIQLYKSLKKVAEIIIWTGILICDRFLLGFVFPPFWYYATVLYFGNYRLKDPRERAGLAASAIAVRKRNPKFLHFVLVLSLLLQHMMLLGNAIDSSWMCRLWSRPWLSWFLCSRCSFRALFGDIDHRKYARNRSMEMSSVATLCRFDYCYSGL